MRKREKKDGRNGWRGVADEKRRKRFRQMLRRVGEKEEKERERERRWIQRKNGKRRKV